MKKEEVVMKIEKGDAHPRGYRAAAKLLLEEARDELQREGVVTRRASRRL